MCAKIYFLLDNILTFPRLYTLAAKLYGHINEVNALLNEQYTFNLLQ